MLLPKASAATAVAAAVLGICASGASADCQWSVLQDGTDAYLESQQSGKPYDIFLGPGVTYRENNRELNVSRTGATMFGRPLRIDHSRRIIDQGGCATFVEIISADPKNPWVIGTQLRFGGGGDRVRVNLIDSVATTTGDWRFNASRSLELSSRENWTTIEPGDQDSRTALRAAADAYLDLWGNQTAAAANASHTANATEVVAARVPWGTPCDRMEGSSYTGAGLANDSCEVELPVGDLPPNTNRRYVIDETVGAVSVLFTFGTMGGVPDSHEFRLEHGRLRYVHTMTVMRNATGAGAGLRAGTKSRAMRRVGERMW